MNEAIYGRNGVSHSNGEIVENQKGGVGTLKLKLGGGVVDLLFSAQQKKTLKSKFFSSTFCLLIVCVKNLEPRGPATQHQPTHTPTPVQKRLRH